MRLNKTAISWAAFVALTGLLVSSGFAQTNTQRSRPVERTEAKGFSDSSKAALSREISTAASAEGPRPASISAPRFAER